MNKFCLAATCLGLSFNCFAQSGSSGPQDLNLFAPAINISVSKTDETEGDLFFADAERNEKRGDLNEALTLFGKAAFEYNSDKKFSKYATSLLRMSNVHLLLSHYNEAEQVVLNSVLKTYAKIGSKSGQMASYRQLGKIYYGAGKLTQSMWFYSQQGILALQLKNNTSYIESILGIAVIKIRKKEYKLALKDLDRADRLAKLYRIDQFHSQIKANRAAISEKLQVRKISS